MPEAARLAAEASIRSVIVSRRRSRASFPIVTGTRSQAAPAARTCAANASSVRRRPGVVPRDRTAISVVAGNRRKVTCGRVKPVVSVVVPTRDRAGYLAVALDSLAAQELREPYEVVVVDDGSTDGTPGVVEHAAQRRDGPSGAPAAPVSSLRHERPRGLNAARNTGIR